MFIRALVGEREHKALPLLCINNLIVMELSNYVHSTSSSVIHEQ